MKAFLEELAVRPLLWDGAMGSLLYERGVFLTRSFDELNLSQPELILQAHQDYVAAGADILETNTFGANRIALARHGYADKAVAINHAAASIARKAVNGKPIFVAGAVGPTQADLQSPETAQAVAAALTEQISTLVNGGVDLILLETFYSLDEIELAISVARRVANGLPIVAQTVFQSDGCMLGGLKPLVVAQRLRKAGAHVVGANCGLGPPELFEIGKQMVACGAPVSIQPNAGLPKVVDGRTLYIANPEHFGVFARRLFQAGVRLVGGCCGTTPEHTRRMMGAARMIGSGQPVEVREYAVARMGPQSPAEKPPVPWPQRSALAAKLADGEFVISCELSSPSGADPGKILAAAQRLQNSGIDFVNIADGPRATARMSNLATCVLLQRTLGMETILHVCCRDRNLLGLVAHLLGAHGLGLRNLVIITGDPPKMGDYPFATPVYDLDAIGLLRVAADLNCGLDPAGKEIVGQTAFVLATGAEPGALDYDRELKRLEEKKTAGAELIMTQPIYDGRLIMRFLDDIKHLNLPVLLGLLPLASHRNAEFLHHNVPGMRIPEEIRARMAQAGAGPAAQAEGIRIAQEALLAVLPRIAGAYIMPPFDRVDAALEIAKVRPRRHSTNR